MYDAIVVGARCAGAPTAMLLARTRSPRPAARPRRPSRATRSRRTTSTSPASPPCARWGLLDRARRHRLPADPRATRSTSARSPLHGAPPPIDGVEAAYAPRRHVLDRILVEAAARGRRRGPRALRGRRRPVSRTAARVGVRTRAGGSVERARLVIGADGRHSLVARAGRAEYDGPPPLTCAYYAYWSGVEMTGVELYPRDGLHDRRLPDPRRPRLRDRALAARALRRVPRGRRAAASRRRSSTRPGWPSALRGRQARGAASAARGGLPNRFRKPYGPGWALVGDAGFHKDPILAIGITDAFRDAELLAEAVARRTTSRADERRRNEMAGAGYATALQFAGLQPPPEIRQLWEAMRGNRELADGFFGTLAGTVSPEAVHVRRRSASVNRRGTAASSPSSYSVTTISSPRGGPPCTRRRAAGAARRARAPRRARRGSRRPAASARADPRRRSPCAGPASPRTRCP